MKFETTKKAINEGYWNVIKIGYCNLQHLLYYKKPIAYTHGVDGWNANIFGIDDNTCICTGYKPFGNYSPDYELQEKYETQAEKIVYNRDIEYDEKVKQLDILIDDFIKEVLENE